MAEITFPKRTDGTATATAGKDYLLSVNTGATEASPTWTLVGGQRDTTLNRTAEQIDASHKTSGGWASTLPGLKSWNMDLSAIYLAGDAGAKFLEAAFLAGVEVHLKMEYPDGSFVTGWGSITDFSLSTPHDDVASISGTINGNGPLSDLQTA